MKQFYFLLSLLLSGLAVSAQSVTSISPNVGYQSQAVNVTITAQNTNFRNLGPGGGRVTAWLIQSTTRLNVGVFATSNTSLNGNVNIPATAPTGLYDLHVKDTVDGEMVLKSSFTVLTKPKAKVTAIFPDSAYQGQNIGTNITLSFATLGTGPGTNKAWLTQGSTVINATGVNGFGNNLRANFAIGTTDPLGYYDVNVFTPNDDTITLKSGFRVVARQGTPALVSISPDSAYRGQTQNGITISGDNTLFPQGGPGGGAQVRIKKGTTTITATGVFAMNTTTLTCTFAVPSTADTGLYDLEVTYNPDGTLTLPKSFRVYIKKKGIYDSDSPDSAEQGQTVVVDFYTENTYYANNPFANRPTVYLMQGTARINGGINVISPTDVRGTFNIPYNAALGYYDVYLQSNADSLKAVNGFKIVPRGTPSLVSIIPDSAYVGNNGVRVTITGAHTIFNAGRDTVWLKMGADSLAAAGNIFTLSNTQLIAGFNIPANQDTGYYDVHINGGGDRLVLNHSFHIIKTAFPIIISVNPTFAMQGQALFVTINAQGASFSNNQTSVWLMQGTHKISASIVQVLSNNQVRANFTFSYADPTGNYDVNVRDSVDGTVTKVSGFYLYSSGVNPPSLVSFNPDSAKAGNAVSIQVRGLNTNFTQIPAGGEVYLMKDSVKITDTSNLIFSDTFAICSFRIPKTAGGGYWSLHVRTALDGDMSKDSFKIIGLPNGIFEAENTSSFGIRVYPNPVSQTLYYELNLKQAGTVKAEILDLSGRQIMVLNNSRLIPGKQELSTDLTLLQTGVYILRIQSPNGESSSRLIKY